MAPDSKLWHRLGEAASDLRKFCLKVAVLFCVFITVPVVHLEARTGPAEETWKNISNSFFTYETLLLRESLHLNPLPPSEANTDETSSSSPAAQWSHRNQIPIPNEPYIQKFVRYYKGAGYSTLTDALERSLPYAPVMTDILEANGVPAELIAVVIVESCFKRHAYNKGAKGYWQLLSGTAREMGLRVDSWVDERLDPVKSTQAAAKYLRSFYERYHSWALAVAAYNAGGGPVDSALANARGSDYWEIAKSGRLPGHTLAFVPKVFAVMAILRDSRSQVFGESPTHSLYDFETVRVKSSIKLEDVAEWTRAPVSRIRDLNPSLCQDRVPPNTEFNLRLPSGTRDKFELAYGLAHRK